MSPAIALHCFCYLFTKLGRRAWESERALLPAATRSPGLDPLVLMGVYLPIS
jgi:hypothetical protein